MYGSYVDVCNFHISFIFSYQFLIFIYQFAILTSRLHHFLWIAAFQ